MVVQWVIRLAPFGIMGLVAESISTSGIEALVEYAVLLGTLLGSMFFVALVVNPIIVYIVMRRNPFPLTFKCLRESGITAFFTRSSAANIPVNMNMANVSAYPLIRILSRFRLGQPLTWPVLPLQLGYRTF